MDLGYFIRILPSTLPGPILKLDHVKFVRFTDCKWMRSNRVWMRSNRVWMRSSRVCMRSSRGWMRSSRVWTRSSRVWVRSIRVVRASDSNAKVATVLGSISASSDTVEFEGWQVKQCRRKYVHEKPV
jgi:hypothetical protein